MKKTWLLLGSVFLSMITLGSSLQLLISMDEKVRSRPPPQIPGEQMEPSQDSDPWWHLVSAKETLDLESFATNCSDLFLACGMELLEMQVETADLNKTVCSFRLTCKAAELEAFLQGLASRSFPMAITRFRLRAGRGDDYEVELQAGQYHG